MSTVSATASPAAAGVSPAASSISEPAPTTDVTPPAIVATDDIELAWSRWLDGGRGVPTGLSPFLRSAAVQADDRGRLVVRPLPGPGLERLSQKTVIDHIEEGLSPYLGRRPSIVVEAPKIRATELGRVTHEEVQADTLRTLFRQEPRLERAVQELDLELMD